VPQQGGATKEVRSQDPLHAALDARGKPHAHARAKPAAGAREKAAPRAEVEVLPSVEDSYAAAQARAIKAAEEIGMGGLWSVGTAVKQIEKATAAVVAQIKAEAGVQSREHFQNGHVHVDRPRVKAACRNATCSPPRLTPNAKLRRVNGPLDVATCEAIARNAADAVLGTPPPGVNMQFCDWLKSLDEGRGSLLDYCTKLEEVFDDLSELHLIMDGPHGETPDPQFFEDIGVMREDHRSLFRAWFASQSRDL